MTREVLRNPFFTVALDEAAAIARITRSAEPFPTPAEASNRWLEVSASLDRVGRKGRSLLTDLRLAPARNDPAFEQAVLAVIPRIHHAFRRNAVVVRLAAGVLQVRRHARQDRVDRLVTSSEEEALAYLKEADDPSAPS